ncbi:5-formyltetrahydrofolate cyclo-ligase [Pseudoroseicyclus tamaricis]|uniref:5-formyltetrahydrofolate cyclo-ligase n=1 Tax=Pseudoroseicyclus tamaricis TaxID=2705421 RepID=A0A6B2JHG7_9RHOB|nr:5-formyltetrahydrofolate cyclo-ligase [Pseudoroseicyclus tamaricis]NDV00693.1 5-formyltetrahydrofolate cyclo-ligase [Pseudoroseicyclus tamaricis]
MTIAADKDAARVAAYDRRAEAQAAAGPGQGARLAELLARHRGVPLAGYLPIRTEIDPLPAMAEAAAHGPVAVPIIEAPATPLRFARWEPGMALVEGPFRTRRPEVMDWVVPRILIVPLLAFTRDGFRLGYGGGFYDRTLAALRAEAPVLAIGFAFAGQEVAEVPLEETDEPLDLIVTEREVIDTAPGGYSAERLRRT